MSVSHTLTLKVLDQLSESFDSEVLKWKQSVEKACEGMDAVVNLAAIVGDPACKKEPDLAHEVNFEAAKLLYESALKIIITAKHGSERVRSSQ